MRKNIFIILTILFGIVTLTLSWQAYQISKETRELVFEQTRPNILLIDFGSGGISHYSGHQNSDHFGCIQGIRLKNAGGAPTSFTDYDVIISYHENVVQYANDRFSVYAHAESDISPAIFSFDSAIFDNSKILEKVSDGNFSDAISLPYQIAPYSAIDLYLETHYILDLSVIEIDQSHLPENDLSISYKLHFASGQVLEIPFLTCQSIK